MRIPRIYINVPLAVDTTIQLDEHAFQHTVKVLRLRESSEIILFNGQGGEYPATLTEVSKKQAIAHINSFTDKNTESALSIHLALGISKGERMDIAIQKAVELGVSDITPLYTERCVVTLDTKREIKRLEHWQGIITSACEQSGRNHLPELHSPIDIRRNFSALPDSKLKLTLSPYATHSLMHVEKPADEVLILIGPEGGLSEQEVHTATQHNFEPVRMGPRILRTETAAITAISTIQMLWGDLGL